MNIEYVKCMFEKRNKDKMNANASFQGNNFRYLTLIIR